MRESVIFILVLALSSCSRISLQTNKLYHYKKNTSLIFYNNGICKATYTQSMIRMMSYGEYHQVKNRIYVDFSKVTNIEIIDLEVANFDLTKFVTTHYSTSKRCYYRCYKNK